MEFGAGVFDTQYNILEEVLPRLPKSEGSLSIGLPQWGIPEWKGILYPERLKAELFLEEYAKRMDCVEVSSSFYAPVGKEKWSKWKSSVNDQFRFLPKWPQSITHKKYLKDSNFFMKEFIDNVLVLEENLGTTLLQLPPQFSIEYKHNLFHFLEALPQDFPVTIEFRHTSWFKENLLYDKLENYLMNKNIGMVISDTPTRQDLFHLSLTNQNTIVRYLSDDNDDLDQRRLKSWQSWLTKNQKESGHIYFVLHMPDNTKTPHLISYLSQEKANFIHEQNLGPQGQLF